MASFVRSTIFRYTNKKLNKILKTGNVCYVTNGKWQFMSMCILSMLFIRQYSTITGNAHLSIFWAFALTIVICIFILIF